MGYYLTTRTTTRMTGLTFATERRVRGRSHGRGVARQQPLRSFNEEIASWTSFWSLYSGRHVLCPSLQAESVFLCMRRVKSMFSQKWQKALSHRLSQWCPQCCTKVQAKPYYLRSAQAVHFRRHASRTLASSNQSLGISKLGNRGFSASAACLAANAAFFAACCSAGVSFFSFAEESIRSLPA